MWIVLRSIVLLLLGIALHIGGEQSQLPCAQFGPAIEREPQVALHYLDSARCESDQGRLSEAARALVGGLEQLRNARAAQESSATPEVSPAGAPIRVGGAIKKPVRVAAAPVSYSKNAEKAGSFGLSAADVVIDKNGRVIDVTITKSIPLLDDAVIKSIQQWKYAPTLVNGAAISVVVPVTIDFGVPTPAEWIEVARFACERKQFEEAEKAAALALAQIKDDREYLAANGEPIRPGQGLPFPKLLRRVPAVYPPEAVSKGVSGMVVLEVVIGQDGRVSFARVIRHHPVFDGAALDQARQDTYSPPLFNGRPVSVIMTTSINFQLGGSTPRIRLM
jgi:TonB family protein